MVVAVLASLPLLFLLVQVVDLPLAELRRLLLRPRMGELLANTVALVAVVTAASVLIGTAAAWLTERSDLRGARAWRVLLVLPVAVPEFVNGYAWVSLSPRVSGLWGAALVSTLSLYPLVYLPVAAMLRSRRLDQDEVAGSLSPTAVVRSEQPVLGAAAGTRGPLGQVVARGLPRPRRDRRRRACERRAGSRTVLRAGRPRPRQ